jgi:pre-mRNA-processing factor 8
MGVKHNASADYFVKIGIPREFYHEQHRPAHFLAFNSMEAGQDNATLADVDDNFN